MSTGPVSGEILADKYRIERVLGQGGMGAVVAAHHVALDQRVAIKYLLPDALKSPEIVERFAREARAAAKIQSEHVARVIDVGRFADGAPYIVMEYLEGLDLAQVLAKHGPLAVEDTVRHVLEASEALAEAHAARIVHRDLKPANLFLANRSDKRAIVKVLDFGISKVVDGSPAEALTKTTGLLGTAYYMCPEQLTTPKAVDHRADIWALGVILHELLSGQPPFRGETFGEVCGGILHKEPEPLDALRPEVPPGLAAVIARCLAKDPDARYASVAALASALEPYAAPVDRQSVGVIRRVLDESAPMSLVMKDTLPLGAGAPVGPPPGSPPPGTSTVSAAPAETAPAAALTAAGVVSSSSTPPPPRRGPLPLVLGTGVGLAVFAVAALYMSGGRTVASKSAPNGIVSTADPVPSVTASVQASAVTSVEAVVPVPSAAPSASVVPVRAAAPPRLASAPRAIDAGAPPTPSTRPPAAPTSSAPRDPLDMGLK